MARRASCTPLAGDVATEQSESISFGPALQPIKPGEFVRCVLTGLTPARVLITNEADTTSELAAEKMMLASTPMGGMPLRTS